MNIIKRLADEFAQRAREAEQEHAARLALDEDYWSGVADTWTEAALVLRAWTNEEPT